MNAFAANLENITKPDVNASSAPVVVVGTGPAGIHLVQELLRLAPEQPVLIYGNEPWEPYNRVKLSSLLAGEVKESDLSNKLGAKDNLVARYNCAIISIDPGHHTVTDQHGRVQPYAALVLATGSRPRIPDIPGLNKKGVFTFRDMADAQALMARKVRSRRTVVLGGGLLGLEAAKAMLRFHTEVCVVEHSNRLMFHQLDARAGGVLVDHINSLGIDVILENSVKEVLGDTQIEGVRLRDGRELACDTLIVAAGIISNHELALHGGLSVGRGIRVDDHMRTSDPDIFAIGECAEHDGTVYGLVAPGLEQAAVAARNLIGARARYHGSLSATTLKVVGLPVFSIGDVNDSNRFVSEYCYRDPGGYRKLVMYRGQIQGAVAIGEWDELSRIQEAVIHQRTIWLWQLLRFLKRGVLWPERDDSSVVNWPAKAIVCNCTGVNRGQLSDAIKRGCETYAQLSQVTGASTVCGSCKPLLGELLGASAPLEPVKGFRPLMVFSVIGLILGFITAFAPGMAYNDSVQLPWRWDILWTDSLFKQISGFTLLGLSVFTAVLSLRKRVKGFSFGDFSAWRVIHVVLGVVTLLVLTLHSGFRFGENLNFFLMLCFSGLLLIGAGFGGVLALEHRLRPALSRKLRTAGLWMHILLFWPVPALLGFHVLKTYYF